MRYIIHFSFLKYNYLVISRYIFHFSFLKYNYRNFEIHISFFIFKIKLSHNFETKSVSRNYEIGFCNMKKQICISKL